MKKIERNYKSASSWHLEQWPEDVERIIKVFRDRDIEIDKDMAVALWEEYSDCFAAGWLGLPEDDEGIYDCIMTYSVGRNKEFLMKEE
jgi:hypothetical protein